MSVFKYILILLLSLFSCIGCEQLCTNQEKPNKPQKEQVSKPDDKQVEKPQPTG